eukprot:m.101420 g.101420  ORF g.101420 m.101420 type:complete len:351 (+) comp13197_c0_seq11:2282-3334(+)
MGVIVEIVVIVIVFSGYHITKIHPSLWLRNPLDAWPTTEQIVGTLCTVLVCYVVLALGFYIMARLKKGKKQARTELLRVTTGFLFVACVALFSRWLSSQEYLKRYGISLEVWALLIDIIVGNAVPELPALLKFGTEGEYFIKVGLVLLGVELRQIGALGGPGILTSWVVTPIVILLGVLSGRYLLGFKDKDLALVFILVCATCVCGASAATAIYGCVNSSPETLTLVIAIVNLLTIPQMIGLPYFAHYVNIMPEVAGAWFGGSIDATGAVVASASILDELNGVTETCVLAEDCAVDVASTVKIIQNMAIGPIAVAVSMWWQHHEAKLSQQVRLATTDSAGTDATTTQPSL